MIYALIMKTPSSSTSATNSKYGRFLRSMTGPHRFCQGTLFFTYYGGEKISETINQLGFDAFVPGNHEFDRGDDYLAEFLTNLTFPTVCANINTNNTALNATIIPYHIFEQHNLAVIGVTTSTIPSISKPGAGTHFLDPIEVVQATVNEIYATTNVTRVIAMTHIGYELDMEMAQKTTGIYMIIGGHSHTLLGDMEGAAGPYPTIKQNLDGEDVFVVTSCVSLVTTCPHPLMVV